MNICILKESLDIGGTERSAANISKALQGAHNVYVALYDASLVKYSYAGELVNFHSPPLPTVLGKIYNTFLRDIKLRHLLKAKKIDVLFTFTGICNRQTRYTYPTAKIISARDFGAMCERHNQYKAALDNSDAMICNSEYTKEYYLSCYPEDIGKVFAVYNYIDIEEITSQAQEDVEQAFLEFSNTHRTTVVSVGRFCKEKGFEYLIEAFAQARQKNDTLGLVLVGDGEYKKKYQELIGRLGIQSHVYFTGFQKNPYKYMKRCTCFVLSSLSEGFPNVLAEAMALGLPVIASNCRSGPAEILRNDKNYDAVTDQFALCDYGVITPQITEKNYANAISQLGEAIHTLLCDQEKVSHYGRVSRHRAMDFSKEATKNQLNSIFSTMLEKRGSRD